MIEQIAVGVFGSVIGALVVYVTSLLSRGFQTTSKKTARFEKELDHWRTGKPERRQAITNEYVFETLRWLFLGNVLWLAPQVIEPFVEPSNAWATRFGLASALVLGLFSFLIGLGVTLRYLRLRRTYDPLGIYGDPRPPDPPPAAAGAAAGELGGGAARRA